MNVLVTGEGGYIGSVLTPMLRARGHDVAGLDTYFFEGCAFDGEAQPAGSLREDVRDVSPSDLESLDALVHLAALSNDPLGDLSPACTYEINHKASVRLAECAKAAGVARFVFSSSCSNYGAGGDDVLDESAELNPVTPYGESKVLVEHDVAALADASVTPTFLRPPHTGCRRCPAPTASSTTSSTTRTRPARS
jgi:nucleoside-diphosphate-sugar epimerase